MRHEVGAHVGAVLKVVDGEQHRLSRGEPGDDGHDGVERAAPGQLVGHVVSRDHAEQLDQLGQQPGPGGQVTTEQRAEGRLGQGEEDRAQHLHERLEEQRPLSGSAPRAEDEAAARGRGRAGLGEEAALADAGHSAHDDEGGAALRRLAPGPVQETRLGPAADQSRHGPRRCAGRRASDRLPAEHRDLEPLGLQVRVGAELVGEPRGQGGVELERGGRPAVADQRHHQVAVRTLVVRVGRDRRGGTRPGQVGLPGDRRRGGTEVPRLAAQLGGPVAEAVGPGAAALVRQVVAVAEHVERPGGGRDRERRFTVGQPSGRDGRQAVGGVEVQLHAPAEGVRRRAGVDEPVADDLAQPAGEGREVARRVTWETVRPDDLGESVGRHAGASAGCQGGEEHASLAGAQPGPGQLLTVAGHGEVAAEGQTHRHPASIPPGKRPGNRSRG